MRAGDAVKKGQLLAELSSDIRRASVDLARVALNRAQAELARVCNGTRAEERGILKAQIDEAEAGLRRAEFEWQRVQRMAGDNATSDKEMSDARSSLDLSRARREAARKRWELAEAGPSPEEIAKAEAVVREAEAQLDGARSVLERTRICSPLDGIVIYCFREPGEVVFASPPSPILTVGDRSELHVRVDVDESDIALVRIGQPVFATAPAFGERQFPGRVVHVEPTLGRKNLRTRRPTEKLDTRIQEVVVALDHADEIPLELQMVVWFLKTPATPAAVERAAP